MSMVMTGKCVECGADFPTSAICLECGGIVSGSTIDIHDLGVGGIYIMEERYRKVAAERDALRAEVERLRKERDR